MNNHDVDVNLATMANITFDEIFSDGGPPPAADGGYTTKFLSPLDSVRYGCFVDDAPPPVPLSPCFSDCSSSAASAAASLTSGFSDVEERYRIDPRVLGSGRHGSVRECVDRATGRRFAVKSVRKSDPAVEPGCLEREIALLREMGHRNVVRLVDVHEDADYVHLVTDLCEGGELFDRIVEKSEEDDGAPCFDEDRAARIMRQILTAVSYMHDRDVVHRDLKPENILFETADEDSTVKIIDFGLARKHSSREPAMTTRAGTPYYMAPEVLGGTYDRSCDLWSAGVIAYILLCGYPPFNGPSNREVERSIRRGKLRFPSEEWSGASDDARDFVRRLLKKDPRRRMGVEEALDHPWLARCVDRVEDSRDDEDCQELSAAEGLFCGFSFIEPIVCGGGANDKPLLFDL